MVHFEKNGLISMKNAVFSIYFAFFSHAFSLVSLASY